MDSPIVSSAEMRAAEEAAFARGITAEALMDQAGQGTARAVRKFFPSPGTCLLYAGKGNNAGDGFVAAAHLRACGWRVEMHLAFPERELSELPLKKSQLLQTDAASDFQPTIVLDALLGVSAKIPLRDPVRAACREINRLRAERNAFVFALDLPSGLDSDSGEADPDCVVADFTITIGFAKRGLIADRALDFVGRIEVVPLSDLTASSDAAYAATPASLRTLLPRRKFSSFKNEFGRVGIVAGSCGFTGAAILCATGALRGGAGLVELFVADDIYEIVASTAPPEVMVRPTKSFDVLLDEETIDAWAIGPGLGKAHADEILELIERSPKPCVVDADGLNILSASPEILQRSAGPRMLTPHPGEMKRLFPRAAGLARAEIARAFCAEYPATLLFKGSRTIVSEKERPLSFNTTGNPGMATGGMGDVLTGICAALIAQHLSPYDAARVAAWVAGRAAELAIFDGEQSEQTLLPMDLMPYLGRAFAELQLR